MTTGNDRLDAALELNENIKRLDVSIKLVLAKLEEIRTEANVRA